MNLNKRADEMRNFFNEKIDGYDELHLKIISGKEKIADYIPRDAKSIIDLGAGTGLQLIKVYKEFPNVKTTAIDVSDEMLKKLEERQISDNITIVNEVFLIMILRLILMLLYLHRHCIILNQKINWFFIKKYMTV